MTAPIASGWSVCRVGLAPTGKPAWSRRTPITDVASIDHLLGADQQPFRDLQPDRLSGLQIDHQFERCWLLDWYVLRTLTAKQPGNQYCRGGQIVSSMRGP